MAALDLLASPIVWFAAMIAVGWLLYAWASRVAPPFQPEGSKTKSFTGGEAIPGAAYQPGYQFFHVALFFTVLHVAALVLVTAHTGTSALLIAIYLGVVSLAVAALVWR